MWVVGNNGEVMVLNQITWSGVLYAAEEVEAFAINIKADLFPPLDRDERGV